MKKIIVLILSSVFLFQVFSQEALKSSEEEYYDFLSLTGVVERPTLGYRTLSDSVWNFVEVESDSHIWQNNNLGTTFTLWQPSTKSDNWFTRGINQNINARFYGPDWFNSYNTALPFGQNDGALWQGRGYNTSLTAGIRLEGFGIEATIKPKVSFSQNLDFEYIPGVYGDPHSYNWGGNVDLVQRYGDKAFWNFDWGDSEIRLTWHALTFGFGNQNPWLGPAILNPMLGSNNAPSYPKFDAGLRKLNITLPYLNWDLGNIEGRIWVGKLLESDYFDTNDSNNERMLVAMSANYEPTFIPGLTIGANRIFLTYWRTENLKYILRLFTLSRSNALASSGNDEDQKFSLFAQWNFPAVGFKIYAEFGRDDFSSNEQANPFHTAIYTVGAKQCIPFNNQISSEVSFEWNNFEMSQDFQLQWPYMGYYAHGFVRQGYSNKGQILGAGSGYFGNSQFLQYKLYYPKGYTSLKFHRYCPNNNSVYSKAVNASANNSYSDLNKDWYANFETYICLGIDSLFYINNDLSISLSYTFIKILNQNYSKNQNGYNHNLKFDFKYTI